MRMTMALLIGAALAMAGCGVATEQTTSAPSISSEHVAQSVTVTCKPSGVGLSTQRVVAQPQGVAVRFDVPGQSEGWGYSWFGPGVEPGGGANVEDGEIYLPIPPGEDAALSCESITSHAAVDPPRATFDVLDPHGHWIDDTIDCVDMTSFARLRAGEPSPVAIADAPQAVVDGVLDGYQVAVDEVRPAGYRDAPAPSMIVVRNGRTIARVPTFARGDDQVIVDSSVDYCTALLDPRAQR